MFYNPFNAKATKHKDAKIVDNHLNPVMLVFIGKLSCARISGVLNHFVSIG